MLKPTFVIIVSALLLIGVSLASVDVDLNKESPRKQRQLEWYLMQQPYWSSIYNDYLDEDASFQRTLLRRPFNSDAQQVEDGVKERLGFGIFNSLSTSRPAAVALLNRLPIIRNPNSPGLAQSFDSCKTDAGEMGICVPGLACAAYRGRPSGSCNFGTVCCVNVVNTCSGQVTLNNTYWETPSEGIARPSSCSLTIKVDQALLEQKRPVCQLRLDFLSFTTEQPDKGDCSKDSFQASGASSTAPVICGDASEQHMYLDVTNSGTKASNVLLFFNFGRNVTVTPTWKIKIAMLPCGADYLAPSNCLQYFTSSSSATVKSFNWKGVQEARQLNNQDYNICFRTETPNEKKTTKLCVSPCTDLSKRSFTLSGNGTLSSNFTSQVVGESFCKNDFLLIPGGSDGNNVLDRYCGTLLSPANNSTTAATVCTTKQPFKLSYNTDGDESSDVYNSGFCLTYQQSV